MPLPNPSIVYNISRPILTFCAFPVRVSDVWHQLRHKVLSVLGVRHQCSVMNYQRRLVWSLLVLVLCCVHISALSIRDTHGALSAASAMVQSAATLSAETHGSCDAGFTVSVSAMSGSLLEVQGRPGMKHATRSRHDDRCANDASCCISPAVPDIGYNGVCCNGFKCPYTNGVCCASGKVATCCPQNSVCITAPPMSDSRMQCHTAQLMVRLLKRFVFVEFD